MSFFSPEKASDLIPVLAPLIEQDPALRKAGGRAGASTAERRGESRRCTELKADVVRTINRIEAYGCVVKDIDLGLLDFPALRDGRQVYLCWKSGEASVGHWHGTDETFVDRKRL